MLPDKGNKNMWLLSETEGTYRRRSIGKIATWMSKKATKIILLTIYPN